jgi:hypothetical protein
MRASAPETVHIVSQATSTCLARGWCSPDSGRCQAVLRRCGSHGTEMELLPGGTVVSPASEAIGRRATLGVDTGGHAVFFEDTKSAIPAVVSAVPSAHARNTGGNHLSSAGGLVWIGPRSAADVLPAATVSDSKAQADTRDLRGGISRLHAGSDGKARWTTSTPSLGANVAATLWRVRIV